MQDEVISKVHTVSEIEALADTMSVCLSIDECNGMRSMKERALMVVRNMPPSRPDIIRCKDCSNYKSEWSPYDDTHYCSAMECRMSPDEWCSRAERRLDN